MRSSLIVMLTSLTACNSSMNSHEQILRDDLKQVIYEDGITLIEAKYIADAYLYLYGGKIGKAPHVQITDGGDYWVGDIFAGVAVSPERASSPPVKVNKKNGEVSWDDGPLVTRVELPLVSEQEKIGQ